MTRTITYCDICGEEVDRDDFIMHGNQTLEQKQLTHRAKHTELKTIMKFPKSEHMPESSSRIDMCFGCSVSLLLWLDGRCHKEV